MSVRGRLWGLDDWFRPVRPDGTIPARGSRQVTPRDRLGMLAFILIGALVIPALLLLFGVGPVMGLVGAIIGVAVGQAVNLYRTRHVGFGIRR